MKKALFIVALIGSMVASADTDSYLYWMVGESAPSYTTAKIRDISGEDAYLTSYYAPNGEEIGESVTSDIVTDQAAWGDGLYAAVDSSSLPQTFIVELFNGDTFVGQSTLSQADALQYIYAGGMSVPTATAPATFSSFAIPEPSSGLLMLVGCAVLGLRRRKQKNA